MITFSCHSCGQNFKVRDEDAGRRTKCTSCGKPIEVPAQAQLVGSPTAATTSFPISASPSLTAPAHEVTRTSRTQQPLVRRRIAVAVCAVLLVAAITTTLWASGVFSAGHSATIETTSQPTGSASVNSTAKPIPDTAPVVHEPQAKQDIDAATIAAYEKLGATYRFEGIPVFQFRTYPKDRLPGVAVPFGLDLTNSEITDAGLKELASQKNLTLLSLNGCRKVTDAGMKELAPAIALTSLHLGTTQVSDAGLKELAPLTNLYSLYLNETRVTDAGIKNLAPLTKLATLYLQDTPVTDAGLKELASLKNLRALMLHRNKVSDAGIKELIGLSLTDLCLWDTPITDSGLKELVQLKTLTTLDLCQTRITDAGIKELATLTKLTRLNVRDTAVTEAGVVDLRKAFPSANIEVATKVDPAMIAAYEKLGATYRFEGIPVFTFRTNPKTQLPSLATPFWLELTGPDITDAGLKALSGLRTLSILSLNGASKITDVGVKELASLTSLTSLHLGNTQVTDSGLKELAPLGNLVALYLAETRVTDAGLETLVSLTKLEKLFLGSPHVTDAGMKALAAVTSLKTLVLYRTNIGDAGLRELTVLRNVGHLDLCQCRITDAGIKDLVRFDKLTWLTLSGTQITDSGLRELTSLASSKSLQTLELSDTKVSDAGLKDLAGFQNLTFLSLSHTQITDVGIKELKPLTTLTRLDLLHTKVTESGAATLRKALPHANIEVATKRVAAIDLLFPLHGVTLGKTTVAELSKLGKRDELIDETTKERYANYKIEGVHFWYFETDVAYYMSIARHQKMPVQWQKVGFDFNLSYDEWTKLFANLGWNARIVEPPKVEKYENRDSLRAEIEVTSGELRLVLRFAYADGATTAAKGTLYDVTVDAPEMSRRIEEERHKKRLDYAKARSVDVVNNISRQEFVKKYPKARLMNVDSKMGSESIESTLRRMIRGMRSSATRVFQLRSTIMLGLS